MLRSFIPLVLLLSALVLVLGGCQADPCREALPVAEGSGGEASLSIVVSGERFSPGRASFPVACAEVTALDSQNYVDTLATGVVEARGGKLRLTGLKPGTADIIVGGEQFFSIKLSAVELRRGLHTLEERLFLYRWTSDFHRLDEIEVELRPGATEADIRPIYSLYDGIEISGSPPRLRLRLGPQASVMRTEVNLLRLCRRLLASPEVLRARPLVDFNLMYPA